MPSNFEQTRECRQISPHLCAAGSSRRAACGWRWTTGPDRTAPSWTGRWTRPRWVTAARRGTSRPPGGSTRSTIWSTRTSVLCTSRAERLQYGAKPGDHSFAKIYFISPIVRLAAMLTYITIVKPNAIYMYSALNKWMMMMMMKWQVHIRWKCSPLLCRSTDRYLSLSVVHLDSHKSWSFCYRYRTDGCILSVLLSKESILVWQTNQTQSSHGWGPNHLH